MNSMEVFSFTGSTHSLRYKFLAAISQNENFQCSIRGRATSETENLGAVRNFGFRSNHMKNSFNVFPNETVLQLNPRKNSSKKHSCFNLDFSNFSKKSKGLPLMFSQGTRKNFYKKLKIHFKGSYCIFDCHKNVTWVV